MKLSAEVTGVGQKISFESGAVVHTMELLVRGEKLTVDINEAQAEMLIGMFANGGGVPADGPPAIPPERPNTVFESANGDQVMIFGDPPEPPTQQPRRAAAVGMDEMGNPIVRDAPPPPPEDPDEDGVPAA